MWIPVFIFVLYTYYKYKVLINIENLFNHFCNAKNSNLFENKIIDLFHLTILYFIVRLDIEYNRFVNSGAGSAPILKI